MQINSSTAICTSHVLLVPYERKHVLVYHEWMKDVDIQAATASEPLTEAQEHEMQQSWRMDRDKLTFIVCRPIPSDQREARISDHDGGENMLGDVNLFLSESHDDPVTIIGELELMIAVKDARRQGYGKSCLAAMLHYISVHENEIVREFAGDIQRPGASIAYMKVKIGKENENSIRFFETMAFEKVSDQVDFFGEFELRLPWGTNQIPEPGSLVLSCSGYSEIPYVM